MNSHRVHIFRLLLISFIALALPQISPQDGFAACTPAPPGLISWWNGEGNANDSIGLNNGVPSGGLTYLPGKVGQAFRFDYNGSITINASTTLGLGISNGFTIETWINPDDITTEHPIAEWVGGVHLWLSVGAQGNVYANIVDINNISHYISSPAALTAANSYQHVAVSYDKSSGAAVLYLNGAIIASQNLGSFTPKTDGNLLIGTRSATYYRGQIDELKVYNRALTSNEILAIVTTGGSGVCAGPFSISATAGTGGSISPNGSVSVDYATSQTFFVTPAVGYTISDVLVDGSSLGAVTSYTFSNVTAGHTISPTFARLTSFNAATDFGLSGNPNGVWSYGWMPTDFSQFNLYTDKTVTSWVGNLDPTYKTPLITKNSSATTDIAGTPAGWVALHPGPQMQPSVLRFTAPFSGIIRIVGEILAGDVGAVQAAVRIRGLQQWQSPNPGAFDLTTAVAAGDVVDVAAYAGYSAGTTPVAMTITYALSVANQTLPDGAINVAYNQSINAFGGTAPYTFSIAAGALPPGLSLANDGTLSGTPTSTGYFDITVRITDAAAASITQAYKITILGSNGCAATPSGLVSWLRGEGNANDQLGGNNGTLINGAAFGTGMVGQAFSLDGVDDYIKVADTVPTPLQIQNEISLEAWIYATQYPAGNGFGLIVGSQFDTNKAGASIFLDGRTNPPNSLNAPAGHINFQIGDGTSWHESNANSQVPLNQWVHVVVTRKANEDAKIYYNGVPQPVTSVAWGGAVSYNGAWFAIGQQKDQARPFKGFIDEVKVYNRAITPAEALAQYNAGGSGVCVDSTPPVDGTLAATGGLNQVNLSWSGFSDSGSGIASYRLVSSTTAIPADCSGTALFSGSTASYTHSGLLNKTTYYYRICAVDALNNTSSGATASAIPDATCVATPSGLVSWWKGEENPGNIAYDQTGANNGTFNNGATVSAGNVGNAFSLNGVSAGLSAASTGMPTGSADRTIALWVNIAANAPMESFFAGYGSANPGNLYAFGANSSNTIFLSNWVGAIWGPTLQNNTWYHLAVVSSGGWVTMYVDGAAAASGSLGLATPAGTSFNAGYLDASRKLNGLLDEVQVFSRALSATEIQGIYAAGDKGVCKPDSTPPADGTLTASPGGSTQINLSWTAATDATGLSASNSYKLVRASGATPPVDCSGTAVYQGTALAFNDTGLSGGSSHSYRVCAYDVARNASSGATATADTGALCVAAPSGLVSWWKGETGSGNVAVDQTGHNNGTFESGVTVASGKVGNAFSLNGAGGIVVPDNASQSPAKQLTISAWVNPFQLPVSSDMAIIVAKEKGSPAVDEYELGVSPGKGSIPAGNLALYVRGLGVYDGLSGGLPDNYFGWTDGGGQVPLNQFSFVSMTVDLDAGFVRTYVNGVLVKEFIVPAGLAMTRVVGADVRIGRRVSSTYGLFNGLIDEAQIYDRALTQAEILAQYNAGGIGVCVDNTSPTDGTLSATGGLNQVNLAWSGFSDNGSSIASYKLVASTNAAPADCSGTALYSGNSTGYTHTTLANGTTWYYRVCAVDVFNNSSPGATATATTDNACAAAPAGLVGWWKGDGDGSSLVGSNTLTLSGSAAYASGKVGQAFTLDGLNSYAEKATPGSELNIGNQSWTVSSWVKTAATTGTLTIASRYECGWNCSQTNAGAFYELGVDGTSGTPSFSVRESLNSSPFYTATAGVDIRDGNWHLLTGTLDRTGTTVNIYIDGQLKNTSQFSSLGIINDAGSPLEIGRHFIQGWGSPLNYFNGQIDEVQIYNRALSTAEILDQFKAGGNGVCSDSTPPTDGALLAAPAGSSQINLSWSAATDSGSGLATTNTYKVVRSAGAAPPADCSGTAIYQGTALLFNDSGLTPATQYAYRVCAYDATGNVSSGTIATATTATLCASASTSLVSWWKGEGNSADQQGAYNGSFVGTATYVAGKTGPAFSLNGSSFVSTSLDAQPSALPSTTWEAWVYPTRVSYGARQQVFSIDDGGYDRSLLIESGTANWTIFTGSGAWQAAPVDLNTWQHIVIVFTPTSIYFYKNGVQYTYSGASAGQGTGNRLTIGRNPSYGEYFQGYVDEAKVYNRALSASEIQAVYLTNGTCSSAPIDGTLTAVPAGNSQIGLSWTAATDAVGLATTNTYKLVRADGAAPPADCSGTALYQGTGLSFNDAGLMPGSQYAYRVCAFNVAGNVSVGATVTAQLDTACISTPSGLVSWWKGEGNADDMAGVNNATLLNGLTFAPGKVGQAFSFDGVDDILRLPNNLISSSTALTFDVWFKTAANGVLLGYQNSQNNAYVPALYIGTDGKLRGEYWYGGVNPIVSLAAVNNGAWHHAALVGNTNSVSLYLDGSLVETRIAGINHQDMFYNQLGNGSTGWWPAAPGRYSGLLDEARIFNRALSAAEIQDIYRAGSSGVCSETVKPADGTLSAVTAGSSQINLSWTAASDAGGLASSNTYKLVRSAGATPPADCSGTAVYQGAALSFNDTGLTPATHYSYQVCAYDVAGNISTGSTASAFTTHLCTPAPAGLVSWWKGEENTNDQTGRNNALLQNGTAYAPGIAGQAFSFDGVDDYLLIGDSIPSSLQIQNEITLGAWIYVTQYPANDLGMIVGSQYDTNTAGASIFLDGRINPDGQTAAAGHIHFQIGGSGSWHASNSQTPVPLNQWVHIVATRKANEDAKIYYNGVLQPLTSAAWNGSITYNGALFAVGQQKDRNRPFNGLLDEIQIFSRALTLAEILAQYNAADGGSCMAPALTINPASKDFGTVLAGTTAIQTFTISSTGTAGLAVGTISLAGIDAASYAIRNDTCSGGSVPFGPGCSFDVVFAPLVAGTKIATVSIPSSDPLNATTSVPLTGTGTVITYTISATAVGGGSISPTGAVSVVSAANQTFTITPNPGYRVVDVLVDGSSVGAVGSYAFSNISGGHSISAFFDQQIVFNSTSEYSLTSNPNGVWSYGEMPVGFGAFNIYKTPAWSNGSLPAIWKNTGAGTTNGVPPGWVSLHPGSGTQPSILRFTAPNSGTIHTTGQFLAGDVAVMQTAVRVNGVEVWHAVDSGTFDLTTNVTAGDTVDFAVYGAYSYGNTPLDATIVYTVIATASKLESGSSCGAAAYNAATCSGFFHPTANTVVQLPPNGLLDYSNVIIPQGVTVTFRKNAANTPVIIRVSGDVAIEGGINVSGANAADSGTAGDGNPVDDGVPGTGGPGGFDGGNGGRSALSGGAVGAMGGAGFGPGGGNGSPTCTVNNSNLQGCAGGGGAYATSEGGGLYAQASGAVYGQESLLPLVGGSGGAGGNAGSGYSGSGGGGGGGGILIAASGTITIGKIGVNGTGFIIADGGAGGANGGDGCGGPGGGGSGGSIRIVGDVINRIQDGALYARRGLNSGSCSAISNFGGYGRIRIEAHTINWVDGTDPVSSISTPDNLLVQNNPTLAIISVAGQAVSSNPVGPGEVTLPGGTTTAIVTINATGIPRGTSVTVYVVPSEGAGRSSAQSSPLDGSSDAATTATAQVILSDGKNVLLASVTYPVTEIVAQSLPTFGGEYVAKIRVESEMGGNSRVVYITASGREFVTDASGKARAV